MAYTRVSTIDTGADFYLRAEAGADGSLYVLKGQGGNAVFRIDADGSQHQVVTTVDAGQMYFGDIDILSNGRILLSAIANTGFGWDGVAQVFGSDGVAATGVFDPGAERPGGSTSAGYTVAGTADGGFNVYFNDISRSSDTFELTYPPRSDGIDNAFVGAGRDLRLRHFDADAVGGVSSIIEGDVETINGGTVNRRAGDQSVYDATTLGNGATVAAYLDERFVGQNGGATKEAQVTVTITGADGSIGPSIKVDGNPFGGSTPESVDGRAGISVLALSDNKFAVVWTEIQHAAGASVFGSPVGWNNFVRYYDGDGNALSDPILFLQRDQSQGNISTYVHAEALLGDRIVFAFNDGLDGVNGNGEVDAFLGIIEANGTASYAMVNAKALNTQSYQIQDLAARSDGSFDLIYHDAISGHQLIAHYADQAVPPVDITAGWIKGSAASETLTGTAGQADVFFFDNAAAGTGADKIVKFGATDVLVTTVQLADSNHDDIIVFGGNKILDLGGLGGSVGLAGDNGKAIVKLEYDGHFIDHGTEYFVYSAIGSAVGVDAAQHHLL